MSAAQPWAIVTIDEHPLCVIPATGGSCRLLVEETDTTSV